MEQYEKSAPKDTSMPTKGINVEKELVTLREQVREQESKINDLSIEIRRLKNELRVAVQAFNLKRG